ncbi:UNKNOWN [Stylonychia lemnae]|uniref:TRP C-terminal domain-containing protein n=1 Tax=Stylonychia lemnae TaxID=5949 RepID=A0A078APT4_STYLE|nr:UNKNOWN [Stylonychia lemnae]|eukprot:CDW82938.1 UNKNOWN [Stylonychia lemnae]
MILRFFLEGYLSMILNSMLNLQHVIYIQVIGQQLEWDSNGDKISSVFAVALFAFESLYPMIILLLVNIYYKNLKDQNMIKRIGSIYNELRTDSKVSLLYNVFFVLRRFTFAMMITILQDHPNAQVQLLIVQCILLIIFVQASRPFESTLLNNLEVFNEICILGVAYHLQIFTDYVPDVNIQYSAGWAIIAITVFNIVTNMGVMIYQTYLQLKVKLKQLLQKCKRWNNKRINDRIQKYQDLNQKTDWLSSQPDQFNNTDFLNGAKDIHVKEKDGLLYYEPQIKQKINLKPLIQINNLEDEVDGNIIGNFQQPFESPMSKRKYNFQNQFENPGDVAYRFPQESLDFFKNIRKDHQRTKSKNKVLVSNGTNYSNEVQNQNKTLVKRRHSSINEENQITQSLENINSYHFGEYSQKSQIKRDFSRRVSIKQSVNKSKTIKDPLKQANLSKQ